MTAIKIIVTTVFVFILVSSQAQTALNLYPINGTVGIKFRTEKKISLEPRLNFQTDFSDGETNVYVNPELFATVNFLKDEQVQLYSGLGVGGNFYNQSQSNFVGSVPLGATYFFNEKRRVALVGECGVKVTASEILKIKSYALVGIQFRLRP